MADDAWTLEAVQALKKMAGEREPATAIAMRLGMDLAAVRAKLLQLGFAPAPDTGEADLGQPGGGAGDGLDGASARDAGGADEARLHTISSGARGL